MLLLPLLAAAAGLATASSHSHPHPRRHAPTDLSAAVEVEPLEARELEVGAGTHELHEREALEARALSGYGGSLPAHPLFVYNAAESGLPPDPSALKGWNMFAMSFWRSDGSMYLNGKTWAALSKAKQAAIHAKYKKAGVKLMIAAFGDGDTPTSSKRNPVAVAKKLATFVKDNNVDGTDIDYEDFDACWDQTCANWVIRFHTELRKQLGSKYIITHAPIAPWFTTESIFAGGYLKVNKQVGSSIDLYLMQFYNQDKNYLTCKEILNGGGAVDRYKETSLWEMVANGVPKGKLLIGKPATNKDAGSGYTGLSTLNTCIKDARAKGWDTGVMSWAWPHAKDANFLQKVWKD